MSTWLIISDLNVLIVFNLTISFHTAYCPITTTDFMTSADLITSHTGAVDY